MSVRSPTGASLPLPTQVTTISGVKGPGVVHVWMRTRHSDMDGTLALVVGWYP